MWFTFPMLMEIKHGNGMFSVLFPFGGIFVGVEIDLRFSSINMLRMITIGQ